MDDQLFFFLSSFEYSAFSFTILCPVFIPLLIERYSRIGSRTIGLYTLQYWLAEILIHSLTSPFRRFEVYLPPQNIPSWRGLIRIMKSNSWLSTGPPKNQAMSVFFCHSFILSFLGYCSLVFFSVLDRKPGFNTL